MSERRSVFILLIGLMLCISLWRISVQELHTEYASYDVMDTMISITNDTMPLNTSPNPTVSLQYLTKTDANTLIDLNNFDYLINQAACDDNPSYIDVTGMDKPSLIAVILVHSAPKNKCKRDVIRETWGQRDVRVRIFFLLGAVNTTAMQDRLENENSQFHDIIQGNFLDTYRNMTYKHTMALKWFVYNCPKLKYLLKTDDDVFVNTPAVFDFMETGIIDDKNLLFCYRIEDARIKRTYRSKWRVSTKEFPGRYYPPYCPGFSIIYSSDVVWRLYKEAQRRQYFWIDDVHITGSIAKNANINITTFGKYFMNGTHFHDLIDGKLQLNDMEPIFLFTEPNLHEKHIRDLWEVVSKSYR